MAEFIIRVELIDLPQGDSRPIYEEFHEAMEARGFGRQRPWPSGLKWLPDATYHIKGELKADDVVEKAKDALQAARRKGRVLVAQTQGGWWHHNLLPVEPGKGKG